MQLIKPRHLPDTAVAMQSQAGKDADLPSGIEGLDMANGLRRVLGKKPLYLSMLRTFVVGQKSVVAEILKSLESNDWETAERLAHSLKGVCGTIGATGLQQLTKKLETAIKERRPHEKTEALLEDLKVPLALLLTQLAQQLPEEPGTADILIVPEQLKVVCDHLQALLTDDDAEAYDVLETNADLLHAAFPNNYRMIDASIRSFDFEAALAALKTATVASD